MNCFSHYSHPFSTTAIGMKVWALPCFNYPFAISAAAHLECLGERNFWGRWSNKQPKPRCPSKRHSSNPQTRAWVSNIHSFQYSMLVEDIQNFVVFWFLVDLWKDVEILVRRTWGKWYLTSMILSLHVTAQMELLFYIVLWDQLLKSFRLISWWTQWPSTKTSQDQVIPTTGTEVYDPRSSNRRCTSTSKGFNGSVADGIQGNSSKIVWLWSKSKALGTTGFVCWIKNKWAVQGTYLVFVRPIVIVTFPACKQTWCLKMWLKHYELSKRARKTRPILLLCPITGWNLDWLCGYWLLLSYTVICLRKIRKGRLSCLAKEVSDYWVTFADPELPGKPGATAFRSATSRTKRDETQGTHGGFGESLWDVVAIDCYGLSFGATQPVVRMREVGRLAPWSWLGSRCRFRWVWGRWPEAQRWCSVVCIFLKVLKGHQLAPATCTCFAGHTEPPQPSQRVTSCQEQPMFLIGK